MSDKDFILTKEYKKFEEFCNACKREQYIGLCYGPPGVGKTLSARYYSHWNVVESFDNAGDEIDSKIEKTGTALYTAEVISSPSKMHTHIIEKCYKLIHVIHEMDYRKVLQKEKMKKLPPNIPLKHRKLSFDYIKLIIVDEADRLRLQNLEQLRSFYDEEKFALILIGMPGIEKKFARYAQLYSRIGFIHEFRPLNHDELLFIMTHALEKIGYKYNEETFNDQETLAAIFQVSKGNFRLLNRLLKQIFRIMQVNQVNTATKEIVYKARECLVIGNQV